MAMPHFSVTYDVADVYQVMADLFYSFWPLVAAAIGLALAAMVFSMIISIFGRWIDDRRG